jgi:hypothetical protein
MIFDEMMKQLPKQKRSHGNGEHNIQVSCVNWFRYQYPYLSKVLFAIPNGSWRDKITAKNLKDEGVTSGVADLILLKGNKHYGGLCIEMKTPQGKQSPAQKEWQEEAEKNGSKYVICHSIYEFIKEIKSYLHE